MSESVPQRRFQVPTDATEIVFVRHGASEPAVPGRPFPCVDGHADPALDVVGQTQAAAVSDRLAASGEQIDAIFSTGLRRTEQTAAPLAHALGLEVVAVPALREVFLGEWEGGEFRIRMAGGDPTALQVLLQQRWDVIPGAEPADAFAARVRAGIEEILRATGPGRRAVSVVHGGVIGEICRQATESRPFAFVHADNGSITRLVVFATGPWMLRNFNDTSHLGVPG